jgi:hypothetical protein
MASNGAIDSPFQWPLQPLRKLFLKMNYNQDRITVATAPNVAIDLSLIHHCNGYQ